MITSDAQKHYGPCLHRCTILLHFTIVSDYFWWGMIKGLRVINSLEFVRIFLSMWVKSIRCLTWNIQLPVDRWQFQLLINIYAHATLLHHMLELVMMLLTHKWSSISHFDLFLGGYDQGLRVMKFPKFPEPFSPCRVMSMIQLSVDRW